MAAQDWYIRNTRAEDDKRTSVAQDSILNLWIALMEILLGLGDGEAVFADFGQEIGEGGIADDRRKGESKNSNECALWGSN